MWAILLSKTGATCLILAAFVGTIAFLRIDLGIKTHERDVARAALIDPTTKVKWEAEYLVAAANLTTCKINASTLKDSVEAQNSSLEALSAQASQRDAALASARQAARKSALAAQAAGNALSTFKATGSDVCQRLLSVDAKVKEMTR